MQEDSAYRVADSISKHGGEKESKIGQENHIFW